MLFIACSYAGHAQYYSKTYPLLGSSNGFISSLQVVDDTIYAMCSAIDTMAPYNIIATFSKFDKYGNLLSNNPFRIIGRRYIWVNGNNLIRTNDGGFAYGESSQNINPTENFLLLLKYDRYGNLQWYNEIPMPDSTYFNVAAFIQDQYSNYYFCGGLGNDTTDMIYGFVSKADSLGNLLITKNLADSGFSSNMTGLCITPKNNILIGGAYFIPTVSNFNNYYEGAEVYVMDTSLTQLQHVIETPNTKLGDPIYVHNTTDGGYVCGDVYGCYSNATMYKNQGSVSKMDSDFHYNWNIISGPCSVNTHFYSLSPSPDGSFISVGQSYDDMDTVQTHMNGWLMKYSNSGQIIWNRLYRGITSDGPNGDDNVLLTIAYLSDSSIICAGQALTYDGNASPPQQGWLLHLDTAGCLPDSNSCGLPDGILNVPSQSMGRVKVYPNPATDQIRFDIQMEEPTAYTLYITDILGQSISVTSPSQATTTTSIDVRKWPVGLYFYRVVSENGFSRSGEFVVSR